MKTAGLIVVGDEILKGQVADQNISYLSPRLHKLGIKLKKISVLSDSVAEIAQEVSTFSDKYDSVITTGGIGPTHDDVTYEGVAAAFGEDLVLNRDIVKFWSSFTNDPEGKKTSTQKFSTVPKSSVILYPNISETIIPKGSFPVVTVRNVIIFPGVPKFFQAIFEAMEGSYFKSEGVVFHNKTVYLNTSEEVITDLLTETVNKFGPGVQFGSYPKFGIPFYRVIITIESEEKSELTKAHDYFISRLDSRWLAMHAEIVTNAYTDTLLLLQSHKLNDFKHNLEKSIQIVEKCLNDFQKDEVFISFNGGKDCTALLHLVHTVRMKQFTENNEKTLSPFTAVYFKPQSPFKEIEDFVFESAQRYGLKLIVKESTIREGLLDLMNEEGKDLKACFMGVRRADPNCSNLNSFQETDSGWPQLLRVSPILDWSYQDVWMYLKELNVPYCPLYDLGGVTFYEQPLAEIRKKAYDLGTILKNTLGPRGRSAMINNRGEIYITRSGIEIISLFRDSSSPMNNFLLKTVEDFHRTTGDGVKTFLILLSSLLSITENFERRYLINQFNVFLKALHMASANFINSTADYRILIQPFLITRFPIHVASVLSSLLTEWIDKNDEYTEKKLDYLCEHFDSLVILREGSENLSSSSVKRGVCLSGHFHGPFPKPSVTVKLVILHLSPDNKDDNNEINSEVHHILLDLIDLNTNDILIVTNCRLPTTSLQKLNCYRLLTHAPCQVVKLLYEYNLNYIKRMHSYPQVSVSNTMCSFRTDLIIDLPIYRLELFTPHKTFSKSYSQALVQLLKLCTFASDTKSPIIKCGQFEKLFSLYFATLFEYSDVIPVLNREELIHFQNQMSTIREKLALVPTNSYKSNEVESIIIKLMQNFKSNSLNLDEEIVSVICQFLMQYSTMVSCESKGFEPLNLKFSILYGVINTFLTVINIQ